MKDCPYCANQIQDAAIKCQHCGERLDLAAEPAVASYAPQTPVVSEPMASYEPAAVAAPKRKSAHPLLLLYLVLGCGAFIAWGVDRITHADQLGGFVTLGAAVAFLIAAPIAWVIGDFVRLFAMPEESYVFGGIGALIKQRLFWMVGPQSFAVVMVALILRGTVPMVVDQLPHMTAPPTSASSEAPTAEAATSAAPYNGAHPVAAVSASAATAQPTAALTTPETVSESPIKAAEPACTDGDKLQRLMCKDPALVEADRQLSKLYEDRLALLPSDDHAKLAADEERWLKQNRAACSDDACLTALYRARIAQFEKP